MEQISRIGMDTSKHFFQLHGVNAAEKVVLRKKLRRKEMVVFFEALAPTGRMRESHPTTWQHGFNVSAEPAREMASRADRYLPSCQHRGRRAGFKLSQSAF